MSRPSRGPDGGRVVPSLSRLYSKPSFHTLQSSSPPAPLHPWAGVGGKRNGEGGIGESEYSQKCSAVYFQVPGSAGNHQGTFSAHYPMPETSKPTRPCVALSGTLLIELSLAKAPRPH